MSELAYEGRVYLFSATEIEKGVVKKWDCRLKSDGDCDGEIVRKPDGIIFAPYHVFLSAEGLKEIVAFMEGAT